MTELINQMLAYTSLPSLHPAAVHLPIALILTAVLFDLVSLFVRAYMWIDRAATALYVLGTVGAGLAYLTGLEAAGRLDAIPPEAVDPVLEHRELALYTLGGCAVVAVIRILVTRLSRFDKRIHLGFFRLVALIAALGVAGLVLVTADRGGELVYQHRLGVEAPLELGGD